MPDGCRRGRLEAKEILPAPLREKPTYTTIPVRAKDRQKKTQVDMTKPCCREMVECERYSARIMQGACAKRWEGCVNTMRVKVAFVDCNHCEVGQERFEKCKKE